MDAIEYARSLREFADWIDAHHDDLADDEIGTFSPPSTVYWFTYSRAQFARAVRVLGRGAKSKDEGWFNVTRKFGLIELEATCARTTVCDRIVHGLKTVTKTVPDPDAPMVEVTEEVEDVEWICPPSLLADEAAA